MSDNFIFKALSEETSAPATPSSALERHFLQAPLSSKLALVLGGLVAALIIFFALTFEQPLLFVPLAALVFLAFKVGPFKTWYQEGKRLETSLLPSQVEEQLSSSRNSLKEIDSFLTLPYFTPSQEFRNIVAASHTLFSDVVTDITSLYQQGRSDPASFTVASQALTILSRLDLIDDAQEELLWLFRTSLAAEKPSKPLSSSRELETTLDSLPFKCNSSMRFGGIYE